MPNDIKLQSEAGTHPLDENLRPLIIGDKIAPLEISNTDVKVNNLTAIGNVELGSTTFDDLTVSGVTTLGASMIVPFGSGLTMTSTIGGTASMLIHPYASKIEMVTSVDSDGSYSRIQGNTNGGLNLITTHVGGENGTILLDADGDIRLDPATGKYVKMRDTDGDDIFEFDVHDVNFKISDDVDNEDYFNIGVGASGVTTLSTIDSDAAVAHLTLDIDGDVILDPVSGITKFYLAGDTDDLCTLTVAANGATTIATADSDGAVGHLTLDPDGDLLISGADVKIDATKKLYLDGGGDTYIDESSADNLQIVVGTKKILVMNENGDDGNFAHFKSSCAGFTKIAETFSDDSIIGSGGTDDTHIDFRYSNKISLAVTGAITNLNLIFPPVSGNFLLLLAYDGDHTITNYKVYEADESAADGNADVFWPGGNKPDNTASGVDILSFFYDATATSDKCYGVASLAFATP